MEWIADQYDQFQKRYQLKNGLELISGLEAIVELKGKHILDLGCGNGELSLVLAEKTGEKGRMTAVDRDIGMLKVFREKPGSNRVEICRGDLIPWLASAGDKYDVVFSNAVFHWLGSKANLLEAFRGIHHLLKDNGYMAIRFSQEGNCEETKRFLEKQLRLFLRNSRITLARSPFKFKECKDLIKESGFKLVEAVEKVFTPFSDLESHFQWMIQSQPLLNYLNRDQLEPFKTFLLQKWQDNPVEVISHHGVYVAEKL